MTPPGKPAPARLAVFEALKAAAPPGFTDEMRSSFLAEGSNLDLAQLGIDSLGAMEFCIAVELDTGITLLPAQLAELACTDAIEAHIHRQLSAAPGGGG